MPADQTNKQKVTQRIKDANNILVTVSRDPSVDELASALAMSLMLDKIGKTSTAVFSGKIPAAIDFLEPGKTFDTNVDGLRDFIIALDKSKADRLRYKVEGDVVRVFITPYRTTITEDDIEFSQGDFNVDLVLAFGVEDNNDLDAAIAAHGRIFHDATIVTVNAGTEGSLGEVNWSEASASSLSEMLVGLMESLKPDLLDEPIATALLTGLVSATDRFRNEKTSPKVMTISAQLMAAGANQQLIAENLENAEETESIPVEPAVDATQTGDDEKGSNPGEIVIERDEDDKSSQAKSDESKSDKLEQTASEVATEKSLDAIEAANKELEQVVPAVIESTDSGSKSSSWRDAPLPSTGGTLNATTEQAAEDAHNAEEQDKNRALLSHDDSVESVVNEQPAINAATLESSEPPTVDIFSAPPIGVAQPASNPTLDDLKQQTEAPAPGQALPEVGLSYEESPIPAPAPAPAAPTAELDNARAAIDAAISNPSLEPLQNTVQETVPPVSQALSPAYALPSAESQPAVGQPAPEANQPLPALPPLPPMPDFSTLPPLPGESTAIPAAPAQPAPAIPSFGLPVEENNSSATFPVTSPAPSEDPTQFQIPGQ